MSLNPRHRAMLEIVRSHGLGTLDAFEAALDFGSRNSVVKVCRRVIAAGYLRSYTLYHRKPYYRLGARACGAFGLDHRLTLPLGGQALAGRFAVLNFCLQTSTRRTLLTEAAELPLLSKAHAYYRDDSGVIGTVKIDYGASPAHILEVCSARVAALAEHQAIRRLLAAKQFEVAVLTATGEKAERLTRHFSLEALPYPVRFGVLPELLHLLSRVVKC